MIIGIDVSTIPYGTGVSNYTLNLVRNLIKADKVNQYKLFYSSLRQPLPLEVRQMKEKGKVRVYHYRLPPTLLQKIWNEWHILPIELFIGRCDVFHTSDWTQPPTIKAKSVCTIHDLTPFIHPEWHAKKVIEAHANKMRWAVIEAGRFICVSKSTKEDLLKIFPAIDPKKIDLIYEAAEDKYEEFFKEKEAVRAAKIRAIYGQYGLKEYILAQGTREPRKNLERLIAAFEQFRKKYPDTKVELAIAGKYGWGEDVKRQNLGVKILGFIPEKDMVALHAAAMALVYPSLYEGFGLPIVKSMKVRVPVITSNTSSLPEVAGRAGILVDPLSVEEISRAIEKVVKSGILRKRLSEKCRLQAEKFSWKKTALETLKAYEKV